MSKPLQYIGASSFFPLQHFPLPISENGRCLVLDPTYDPPQLMAVYSSCGKTGCCGAYEIFVDQSAFNYKAGSIFETLLKNFRKSIFVLRVKTSAKNFPEILANAITHFNAKYSSVFTLNYFSTEERESSLWGAPTLHSVFVTLTPVEKDPKAFVKIFREVVAL